MSLARHVLTFERPGFAQSKGRSTEHRFRLKLNVSVFHPALLIVSKVPNQILSKTLSKRFSTVENTDRD